MDARLRPGTSEDTTKCGLILFEAFSLDERASSDRRRALDSDQWLFVGLMV